VVENETVTYDLTTYFTEPRDISYVTFSVESNQYNSATIVNGTTLSITGGARDNQYGVTVRAQTSYGYVDNTLTVYEFASYPTQRPIAAMTADTTVISGAENGNGTYVATSSSGAPRYHAFDHSNDSYEPGWLSAALYDSNGLYTSTTATVVDGSTILGEWIQLDMPTAIRPNAYAITPFVTQTYTTNASPYSWVLAGSIDGSTWTMIDSRNQIDGWQEYTPRVFATTNMSGRFTKLRFIGRSTVPGNDNSSVAITELLSFTMTNTMAMYNNKLHLAASYTTDTNVYSGVSSEPSTTLPTPQGSDGLLIRYPINN
jgi:hypothetical protein